MNQPLSTTASRIDATGWGLFFIWVAIALLVDVGWGIAILGTGVISLGVQLARRLSAQPVDGWVVGFGCFLVLVGLSQALPLELDKAVVPGWTSAAVFAAIGVAILVSTWARRHPRE